MLTANDIRETLGAVKYRDWHLAVFVAPVGVFYLQAHWYDEQGAAQASRKWQLSPHMCRSELVQTALKCVLTAEEHEARERFTYRGRRIFGPHFDVDVLHAVCDGTHLELRK